MAPDQRETRVARCRTCHAAIFWATFQASGKRAPIDLDPVEGGNLVIVGHDRDGPLVDVLRDDGRLFTEDQLRYVNHWATCTAPPPRRR
jgi:hypothetical protein